MRNLALNAASSQFIDVSDFSDIISVKDKLYILRKGHISCYHNSTENILRTINDDKITSSFQHLPIEEAIYFSTTKDVIFISTNGSDHSVFNFDLKIESTAWNPAQDSLLIIFEDGSIGLFSFNLKENIFICKESSHLNFECPETISVGWGSDKTQFRGPLKEKTIDVLTIISDVLINNEADLEPPSAFDNKKPIITWRSNGEMFAVNYWKNNRRSIKFFNEECQPLFENDSINGLQPLLVWRPFGAGITSAAVVKNNTYLIFFEKNATLRHEFKLEHQIRIEDLKWDQSGNLLSMYLKMPKEDSSQIRIYIIRNHHLYLKQTLAFDKIKIINFNWCEETSLSNRLSITTSNRFLTFDFKLVVNKMYVYEEHDCTIVAVIDGYTLHFCRHTQSDCSSYKKITFSEPVNSVTFNEAKVIIFGINHLFIYHYQNIDEDPVLFKKISLNNRLMYYNPIITPTSQFMITGFDVEGKETEGRIFELNFNTENIFSLAEMKNEHRLSNNIKELYYEVLTVKGNTFRITMDQHRNIYLNSKLIWNNISSFTIHCNYLFLTTKDTLIGVHVDSLDDVYNQKSVNLYTRMIELGSVLICGMGSTSNLILQALRGNIEIISCVLINIDKVDKFLEENKWQEAWDIVRLSKLNSNVLFDLNPERFLKTIPKFIRSSVLFVFLSELEEDNVLLKIYTESRFKPIKFQNKVTTVCTKIIEYLREYSYVESLTSIVHACLIMPERKLAIKEALKYIQTLFRYNSKVTEIQKSLQNAIEFMLKYVQVKDAYEAALSLYDLELAVFIARNSEMDPKEYIDFTAKLKKLPELERNFTISDYLGNHYMAVFYLYEATNQADMAEKEKLLNYMEKHDLQKALYDNISENSPIYSNVVQSYGKKLAAKKLYDEAGFIFEKACMYKEAAEMYTLSKNWKKAIGMIKKLDKDELNFKRDVKKLADDLVSSSKSIDASYLYEMYLGDYESAIKILCDKHHLNLAYELAEKYSRFDIVETNILPALQEFSLHLYTELENLDTEFSKYKIRLLEVRKEKTEKLKYQAGKVDDDFQAVHQKNLETYDDLQSVLGSTTSTKYGSSVSSRSSRTSSSSRRKQQRKIEDLREGGRFEDIALIQVLYKKIVQAVDYSEVVRDLCFLMLKLNLKNDARKLHNLLFQIQSAMKKAIKDIWPDNLIKLDEPPNYETRALQDNLLSLDSMYWKPPVIKLDWVIHLLTN